MDYQINYPITQFPGESIFLQYTKGYRDVQAEYKNHVFVNGLSARDLKRGVKVNHPELGLVELKFAKEKMVVNVIVDGYHSSINKDHPKHRLANVSTLFWTLFGFTCLTFLLFAYLTIQFPLPEVIIMGPTFTAVALVTYGVTAYNLKKGKSAFFWLGLGMYVCRIMIAILTITVFVTIVDGIFGLIIRVIFLIALLACIPIVVKHRKYEPFMRQNEPEDPMILDAKV